MVEAVRRRIVILLCSLLTLGVDAQRVELSGQPSPNAFPLVAEVATDILVDANDAAVVDVAAGLLTEDVERVTGLRPRLLKEPEAGIRRLVIVGSIGGSRYIDALAASGKLDVSHIRGQWESYIITRIEQPFEGIDEALVIAGSDRRGTAYGVFTLSESIGVSPWYWWADVPVPHRDRIYVSGKPVLQGPPSVKYRGIFINDEDWGMQPWAAKHMDQDIGDIGPRTYARIFELLLRLKANYIWPAMHACTQAFNIYPENKVVADRYAMVMGASHCEPMLRNNVTEWDHDALGEWNYEINHDAIYTYWEQRVMENGRYENVYTVGMRGIHDSDMPGGGTLMEKKDRLEWVIGDQRKMLAEHVNADPSQVPQIFCPYKEVLNIYKQGLELPDDVTIVWPDDNFGYIRNLSTTEERTRAGGSGIYYHLSYLGSPQEFLWLGSTSPALTAYEMQKAYAYGADRLWVFNVGDLKPIEKEMDFALRLAYDVDRYPVDKAMDFLRDFAVDNFGADHADEIADVLRAYYHLTAEVKPEHNDQMTISRSEQDARVRAYGALVEKTQSLYEKLPEEQRDAFFQLVFYPVNGAALMNLKHTAFLQGDMERSGTAYERIQELTVEYNKVIAGGKWDGMMDASPRNGRVFSRLDIIGGGGKTGTPLFELEPADARTGGSMMLENNALVAKAPETQSQGSIHAAVMTFESSGTMAASIYFLARTIDDKHDSWFVDLNGRQTVQNDVVTGNAMDWIKVMDADLVQGENTLTIGQREPGTALYRVAVMKRGESPAESRIMSGSPVGNTVPEPLAVIPAADYADLRGTTESRWIRIPGLGIEESAMTLQPFESRPVTDVAAAPAIAYAFRSDAPVVSVEVRFLPTHRIHEGLGLRYAIGVDGGAEQIMDINSEANASPDWSHNVLSGYSRRTSKHVLNGTGKHTVTIRLLDPGMVLSQVRVFADE